MVDFNDYSTGKININELVNLISTDMNEDDYFTYTFEELAYVGLRQINFKGLKNTSESVSKHVSMVMNVEPLLKTMNHIAENFARVYMDIKKLPVIEKSKLEKQVKMDLKQITDLISFYETLSFIKEFKAEYIKPRSQEEKAQLVFYQRTLVKRDEIVSYLTDGVGKRAIEKSKTDYESYRSESGKTIELQLEFHADYPYTDMIFQTKSFVYGLDIHKLDYRKINLLWTKIQWSSAALNGQYTYDKVFNDEIQRKIKPKAFFAQLLIDLKSLPIIRRRIDIFIEMQALFLAKKWYGFYALALPQVEGIFTEMMEVTDQKKAKGSLPDKVKLMRPHYSNSEYSFDYFEYALPTERNHFSHTGLVDHPKDKSYHLLLDVKYLFNVALELDTPLAKLSKLIKEGVSKFEDIGELADFIKLVRGLKMKKKLDSVETDLDDFVYKDLVPHIDLPKFLGNLEIDFEESVKTFSFWIQHFKLKAITTDFFNLLPEVVLQNMEQIDEVLGKLGLMLLEDLKVMTDSYYFVQNFDKLFPEIPARDIASINHFRSKFKKELKIALLLDDKSTVDKLDIYLLKKDKFKHKLKLS